MAEPSYGCVLSALCRSITKSEAIRVKGKQEGYRCKATYSLLPRLRVSPLSEACVNKIANAVGDVCTKRSRIVSVAHDFFFEVCVKVSRDNQYMVKLSLLNQRLDCGIEEDSKPTSGKSPPLLRKDIVASTLKVPLAPPSNCSEKGSCTETLFDVWRRSAEPSALEDHLRAVHPGLVALVAHVCLPSPEDTKKSDTLHRKPDKHSAYVPIARNGNSAMVEYTPNGHPFWLSADSFCEVNHDMENAIYEAIVQFLRLPPTRAKGEGETRTNTIDAGSTVSLDCVKPLLSANVEGMVPAVTHNSATSLPAPVPKRRAFISGRDVNSVVHTFAEHYSDIMVVTTCPCVHADAKKNNIPHCVLCRKDQIALPLRAFALPGNTTEKGDEKKDGDVADDIRHHLALGTLTMTPLESHCLITAGRHGLHPNTTIALMELGAAAAISDLIYVSCNVESLTRDVHVLKETWHIAHARTFDFFPGTNYVMTVLHLRPLFRNGNGDLLVLPVGLPGTGKSTCGRALEAFFQNAVQDKRRAQNGCKTQTAPASLPPQTKKAKKDRSATTPACFVPRALCELHQRTLRFRHVERDQLFHERKEAASLRVARQQTHDALVAALGVWNNTEGELHDNDRYQFLDSCCISKRRILFLDSTNGSGEARALYQSLWRASSQQIHRERNPIEDAPLLSSCVILFFDTPDNTAELLRRVQHRDPHPSFPSDVKEQQRKFDVITAALRGKDNISTVNDTENIDADGAALSTACWRIHASAKANAAKETIAEVVLTVCAHLLFSSDLVTLLREDALQLLRETM